ncbi:MAG: RloB family protein [Candidatus Kapaibacteriota bacterium]
MNKAWERKQISRPKRSLYDTVLIVCEGEKTEVNYFRAFPQAEVKPFDVVGTGKNTLSLVQEAERLQKAGKEQGKRYNQVWCVFDMDSFKAHFSNAISSAKAKEFKVAYSNEAFELWYLLHFSFHDADLSRQQYGEKLTKFLGKKYDKAAPDMYQTLLERQIQAIQNAEKLMERYEPHNAHANNPSTTVHTLVQRLNELAKGDTSPQSPKTA